MVSPTLSGVQPLQFSQRHPDTPRLPVAVRRAAEAAIAKSSVTFVPASASWSTPIICYSVYHLCTMLSFPSLVQSISGLPLTLIPVLLEGQKTTVPTTP